MHKTIIFNMSLKILCAVLEIFLLCLIYVHCYDVKSREHQNERETRSLKECNCGQHSNTCKLVTGGKLCTCKPGFLLNKQVGLCLEICGKIMCEENQVCSDNPSLGEVCVCPTGKRGDTCELKDECIEKKFKDCMENPESECKYHKNESAYCDCGDLKQWDDSKNKCLETCGNVLCEEYQECSDNPSLGKVCVCPAGKRGDTCELKDECIDEKFKDCSENPESECKYHKNETAYCDCGDLKQWDDSKNKCIEICGKVMCEEYQVCSDNPSLGKVCVCPTGKRGDACELKDECIEEKFKVCRETPEAECKYHKNESAYCDCGDVKKWDNTKNKCLDTKMERCIQKCGKNSNVICIMDSETDETSECTCEDKTMTFNSMYKYCQKRCEAKCGLDEDIACSGDQQTLETTICGCIKETMMYKAAYGICEERCKLACGKHSNMECSGDQKTFETTHCSCKNKSMTYDVKNKICEDPCDWNPCQNGGRCRVKENIMNCTCILPYFGEFCEADPCTTNPCHNLGHCSLKNGTAKCTCIFPYSGDFCETNPCSPNPCKNRGQCYIEHDEANCMCRPSFSGEFCETGPCTLNPCKNGGYCKVQNNQANCSCLTPYTGEFCERDPCTLNPCQNGGHCRFNGNRTHCTCMVPYFGDFCEADPCSPNPCKNRGHCYIEHDEANCMCRPPFSGEFCETGPCTPNPCRNGGYCSVQNNRSNCSCLTPYTGDLCEKDPCTVNPCRNGGHCYVEGLQAKCTCEAPYSGNVCEINPCSPNPCQNGGSCFAGKTAFKCVCKERFSGDTCENESKLIEASLLALVVLVSLVLICGTYIGCKINHSLKMATRDPKP